MRTQLVFHMRPRPENAPVPMFGTRDQPRPQRIKLVMPSSLALGRKDTHRNANKHSRLVGGNRPRGASPLYDMAITTDGLHRFKALSNLTRLSLHGTRLTSVEPLRPLTKITCRHLRRNFL